MTFVSRFKRLLAVLALAGLASTHCAFAAQSTTAQSPKPIDIVFDLDDTLIRWVRSHEILPAETISAESTSPEGDMKLYRYRILAGGPELLQSLANRPNVRVSFFSLGSAERNEAVLKKYKLPDGRSAWDIAYKVLSDTDASPKHEKDMTKFNPDANQVLIVDDKVKTTIKGQRKNVVQISGKVEHFYSAVNEKWNSAGGPYSTTPTAFVQAQNKLAYASGVLDKVFELVKEKSISPLDAATSIQYSVDSQGRLIYKKNIKNDLQFYRQGVKDFHNINPAYRFTSAYGEVDSIRCIRDAVRAN